MTDFAGYGESARVLVIGGDGLIGAALASSLTQRGFHVQATSRRPGAALFLDLAHSDSWPDLGGFDLAVIVAALARLGDCDREPERSFRINALGPKILSERLARLGTYVLHLSSDKVFDGTAPFRRRDEATSPTTVYGRHKAEAETAVLAAGGGVLRLSKVLSPNLALVDNWAKDLRAGREIHAFSDMWLAPVSVQAVVGLIGRLLQDRTPGVFHLSGAEDCPYSALAEALAAALGAPPEKVVPVPTPAPLAAISHVRHSTLDMAVEHSRYGVDNPAFGTVAAEMAASLSSGIA